MPSLKMCAIFRTLSKIGGIAVARLERMRESELVAGTAVRKFGWAQSAISHKKDDNRLTQRRSRDIVIKTVVRVSVELLMQETKQE